MKNAFCLLALLFLTACAAPPIYITPKVTTSLNKEATTTGLEKVKTAKFQIKQIEKIDLHDFKRAFIKKYGSEEEFKKQFQTDLSNSLNKEATTTTEIFDLEITKLVVDSYADIYFSPYPLPGTGMVPVTTTTEYCVIKIDFCVKTPSGEIILEGRAAERTAECQLPHLNQSKLANAVSGVQQHLVDYIRGRMPSENIYGSDSTGELSKSVNIQEPLPLGIQSVVIQAVPIKPGTIKNVKGLTDAHQLFARYVKDALAPKKPGWQIKLADEEGALTDRDITISTELLDIDGGSVALRFWMGFGMGETHSRVQVSILDKTGRDLVTAEISERTLGHGGEIETRLESNETMARRNLQSLAGDVAEFIMDPAGFKKKHDDGSITEQPSGADGP